MPSWNYSQYPECNVNLKSWSTNLIFARVEYAGFTLLTSSFTHWFTDESFTDRYPVGFEVLSGVFWIERTASGRRVSAWRTTAVSRGSTLSCQAVEHSYRSIVLLVPVFPINNLWNYVIIVSDLLKYHSFLVSFIRSTREPLCYFFIFSSHPRYLYPCTFLYACIRRIGLSLKIITLIIIIIGMIQPLASARIFFSYHPTVILLRFITLGAVWKMTLWAHGQEHLNPDLLDCETTKQQLSSHGEHPKG